jgi:hypothetical protein
LQLSYCTTVLTSQVRQLSLAGEQMSLNYMSRILADLAIRGISGRAGIGCFQLRFSIEFTVPAWPEESDAGMVTCENFRARVLAGRARSDVMTLGWAVPESLLSLQPRKYSSKEALLFDLDLSPQQFFSLEELRAGDDLQFELQVSGQAKGALGTYPAVDTIQRLVTLSDWSVVLRQLRYSDTLVIGLEIPLVEVDSTLANAVDCIRRAHECLHHGQYDVVVAQCRLALDGLQAVGSGRSMSSASVEKFKGGEKAKMTKLERELLMGEAVRHYTHLAHHVGLDGAPVSFGRRDALTVLTLTSAAIASAVSRERVRELG